MSGTAADSPTGPSGSFEETYQDKITGYTDNYIKAYAEADGKYLNTLCNVKITGLMYDGVSCEILEEEL